MIGTKDAEKLLNNFETILKLDKKIKKKKREKIRKENEGKIREKSPIVIDDDSEPEFFIGNTNDSNQEFFTGNPVPENNDEFEISSVLDNDEIVFVSEKIPKKRKISPEKNSSEKRPKIKAESSRHFEEPEVKSLAGTFSSNFFQAFQKPIEIPDCIVIDESDDNFDLSNLKEKSKDESRAFLKASRKKNEHCELSLICPIDDKRVVYPVRGKECAHKEIFDAKTFLDRKLKNCPICTSPLIFTDLEKDLHISEFLLVDSCSKAVTVTHMGGFKLNNKIQRRDQYIGPSKKQYRYFYSGK